MTPWNQKHKIKRWIEYSSGVQSMALHNLVCGYETRGKRNRELRVESAKMHLLDYMKWVTKRYSK